MKPLLIALALCLAVGSVAAGEKRPAPAQRKCPISGKPVDGSSYVDVDGFRVLTLGPRESDEVRKNPGKAFAALAKNREAALPIVWMCPGMMRQVDSTFPFVQQAGKRIYYCCQPCVSRIKKDFKGAADTMKRLAEQGG